jgi:hypothetical protein
MDAVAISTLRARVCVETLAALRTIARYGDSVSRGIAERAVFDCVKILQPLADEGNHVRCVEAVGLPDIGASPQG